MLLITDISLTTHPRRIDKLPCVAQRALDEIENGTGYKAILIVGGLTPADNGAISTIMYVLLLFFSYPLMAYAMQPHNWTGHCDWVVVCRVVGWNSHPV